MKNILFVLALIGVGLGIANGSQEVILISIGLVIFRVILGSMSMLQVETTAEIAGNVYHFKAKHPAGIEALEFEDKPNSRVQLIFEIGLPEDDHVKSTVVTMAVDPKSGMVVESQFYSTVRHLNSGKTYEISFVEKRGFAIREK